MVPAAATVLVLTHWLDPTADLVVEELHRREVPVFRCDPADFPQRLTLEARLEGGGWAGCLRLPDRRLELADVGCAWWRKPTQFVFPDSMSEADRTWAQREARRGLGGVVHAVPRWLNHPVAIGRANYKPVQLVEAQRVGLRVPQTVITNEPRVAARLAARVGAVVYKPFYSWLTDDDGRSGMVYTVPVSEAELDDASIRLTAHLFQERVPKQYEIRLTVVDAHMFAVRIDVVSDHGKIDWRADHTNLIHSLVDLPERVARQVRLLMHRLGLRFAAIDLIVTPDDDYVFLEANPNGQWGWMEHEIGVPIAAAVADALTAGPGKSNAGKSGAVRASAVGMPGGVVAHE